MDNEKWKSVLRKNYHQLIFVFIAFLLMILVSIISLNTITHKKLLTASEEALYTVEANIKTNLRESEATLVGSTFTVRNMVLEKGASRDEILQYLISLTDWLLENNERVSGFNGIYGVVRGDYLDGMEWEPSADYIPHERPWYISAEESGGEIAMTAPYVDAHTHTGVISLAQEFYDEKGDPLGVISLDIMLTRLTEYVCSLQHGYGGYGMLLDGDLNIVAHPTKEFAGLTLTGLSGDYAGIADELMSGMEISGKTIRDTDGKRMILFFRKLYNGWYVGMLTPADSYYGDLYRTEALLISLGIILMLALNFILMRLAAAKMRSDEENQLKSSFLARMSHEIRTPMNAILGMVELILRKDLPQEVCEEATAIKQAGNNLLSIINDILDFSKIEANRMELAVARYQLASLLNDVINIIRVRVEEKLVLFSVNIDSSLPAVLIGDEVRLRQILLNLLSNAVKYTHEGQVSLTVGGETTKDDMVILSFKVADTGIGIKEEDMDKLFGDFTQLDTHRNLGIEGTGLGLAITYNLCRLMGGRITVSSVYGEGSVFAVSLPQEIADRTPMGEMNSAENSKRVENSVRFTVPSARILIVDDAEVNLKVAEGLLSPYNAQIDCCTNGKNAIRLVCERSYDLVFMDHMMPEMDGIEAVRRIRALGVSVPVIALTANAISGMQDMYLENGFNDYLAKPIEMAKLHEIIRKWIPKDKRVYTDTLEKNKPDEQTIALQIEGIDVKRGLMMTGNSAEQYRKVLALFCRDAAARMDILREPPDEENTPKFVTQVHALKSALSSIGASALSEQAAYLEKSGLAGDVVAISERLEGFITELEKLTRQLKDTLDSWQTCGPSEESIVINADVLLRLKKALTKEDIGEIDASLGEIEEKQYTAEIKAAVTKLSEHILMSDYDDAISIINSLLREV